LEQWQDEQNLKTALWFSFMGGDGKEGGGHKSTVHPFGFSNFSSSTFLEATLRKSLPDRESHMID
jgi:hypothetical protein